MVWMVTKSKCDICQHQWVAVSKDANTGLECPVCGNMTGYPKDDTKEDWQE